MPWITSRWAKRTPAQHVLLRVFFGGPHTRARLSEYGVPRFPRASDGRDVPYICAVTPDFGVRLSAETQQSQQAVAEHARHLISRKRGVAQEAVSSPAPRFGQAASPEIAELRLDLGIPIQGQFIE